MARGRRERNFFILLELGALQPCSEETRVHGEAGFQHATRTNTQTADNSGGFTF